MKTIFARMAVVAAVLLMASPIHAQFAPRGKQLTGDDLRALFGKGRTVEFLAPAFAETGKITYRANGTATHEHRMWQEGTRGGDDGKWRIDGDLFCVTWMFIRSGRETCFKHYRISPLGYSSWFTDGTLSAFYQPLE